VGRRSRQRNRETGAGGAADPLAAPTSTYTDADGNELELRGTLTAGARREYAQVLGGGRYLEDAWQRAVELLFERLAVRWTVAGVDTVKQKELVARYRMAGRDERQFVRDSLRAHVAEHFPELQAP
jgi:hypothetical protein